MKRGIEERQTGTAQQNRKNGEHQDNIRVAAE
jgi:hypothetical protein